MSEERRANRAKKRAIESGKSGNTTIETPTAKIVITKNKVDIIFFNKKITYFCKGSGREYANYALLLNEDLEAKETKEYIQVLTGIEMLPSYAHLDANIASELYNVIIDDFQKKLDSQVERSNSDEENTSDANAILEAQIKEILEEAE